MFNDLAKREFMIGIYDDDKNEEGQFMGVLADDISTVIENLDGALDKWVEEFPEVAPLIVNATKVTIEKYEESEDE